MRSGFDLIASGFHLPEINIFVWNNCEPNEVGLSYRACDKIPRILESWISAFTRVCSRRIHTKKEALSRYRGVGSRGAGGC